MRQGGKPGSTGQVARFWAHKGGGKMRYIYIYIRCKAKTGSIEREIKHATHMFKPCKAQRSDQVSSFDAPDLHSGVAVVCVRLFFLEGISVVLFQGLPTAPLHFPLHITPHTHPWKTPRTPRLYRLSILHVQLGRVAAQNLTQGPGGLRKVVFAGFGVGV